MKLTPKQRVVMEAVDSVEGGLTMAQLNPKLRPVALRLQDGGALSKRSRHRLIITKLGRAAMGSRGSKP